MSLNFDNKTYSDSILSCSVGDYFDSDVKKWNYLFNADGQVLGPNGQWQLDPDLPCESDLIPGFSVSYGTRPVFATCKNNCPGGELCY